MFNPFKLLQSVLDNKKANEKWKNEKEEIDRFFKKVLKMIRDTEKEIEREQAEFERLWRRARGELRRGYKLCLRK